MRLTVLLVAGLMVAAAAFAQSTPDAPTPTGEGSGEVAAPAGSEPAAPVLPDLGEGWLGVGLEQIEAAEATSLGLDGPRIRVTQVFPQTPAAASEFAAGDLILRFNDYELTDVDDLIARTRTSRPGTVVAFTLRRGDETLTQPVMLGMRPEFDELLVSIFVGAPAPPLAVHRIADDAPLELAENQIAVVDFWATWCGPCRRAIPTLNQLNERYSAQGVSFIGVSSEEPAVLRDFVANNAVDYTIAYDVEQGTTASYFITAYPTLFVIDGSRTVRQVFIGGNDLPGLEATLQALLSERAAQ